MIRAIPFGHVYIFDKIAGVNEEPIKTPSIGSAILRSLLSTKK